VELFRTVPRFDPAKAALIRLWVREILDLAEDRSLLVTQLACMEDGCPPLETVIAISGAGGGMRRFKFHRSIDELTKEEVVTQLIGEGHRH
jgi:hypothetical protein